MDDKKKGKILKPILKRIAKVERDIPKKAEQKPKTFTPKAKALPKVSRALITKINTIKKDNSLMDLQKVANINALMNDNLSSFDKNYITEQVKTIYKLGKHKVINTEKNKVAKMSETARRKNVNDFFRGT